ncbi:hypothetical protein GCM10011607_04970 [Shewanella inventionis]|uniref:Uncharacterized protein n=1 Tax=Shewanella inventionis TaxID=1738770 RepID=A0ABQ1IQR8_9GAMM|nr:hypothetical protein GCM10011607_04970 [Shewanella inventionis]
MNDIRDKNELRADNELPPSNQNNPCLNEQQVAAKKLKVSTSQQLNNAVNA